MSNTIIKARNQFIITFDVRYTNFEIEIKELPKKAALFFLWEFCSVLAVADILRIHVMVGESVPRNLLPRSTRFAVIAVGINGDTAARKKTSPDFDVFGIHEPDQIFHDDVYAVFMEVTVIAE